MNHTPMTMKPSVASSFRSQEGLRNTDSVRSRKPQLSRLLSLGGLAMVGALAGCSLPAVGPDYRTPTTSAPSSYKDNASPLAPSADSRVASDWWRDFGDTDLNACIDQALKENQGIKGALARVEQARALTGQARASYLPMVGATGLATREQTSETVTNQFQHSLTTSYRLPLTLSWELDLFGRVRRLSESAQAGFVASQELAESTRLSVVAETASAYFALAATDQERRIVEETLALQKEMSTLVEARRDAGRASDLALEQARLAVASSEADLAAVESRRSALKNGLAVLLGQAAPDFEVGERAQLKGSLPHVPVGLPSELLLRRPDLAAAESGIKAANAQIGVAKASFFPAISLTGSAGYASAEVSDLFQRDSRAWAIGPSVYLPLFQGGRNRANYQRSQAAYEEAIAGYRQTVLNAFREVQDALTASQRLTEQSEAIARAVANARRARELAEERYRAGGTSYLEVIDAQRTALAVERSAAAITGQRWITRVTLIRALGGGWEQPATM